MKRSSHDRSPGHDLQHVSWDLAQSPDLVWQKAGQLPRGTSASDLESGERSVLLQDEPRIRIVLSQNAETSKRQVSKIYRTPLTLTWRDLFRYPQAQREFENLQYAYGKGLPVAEPLGFGLRRIPGRDWFSQLTMAYLGGDTLRDRLASRTEGREALVSGAGRLVAAMHKAGMVWGKAHLGNFMVDGHSEGSLTAFDVPYALCTGKDMTRSRFALYDVWNMVVDLQEHCRLNENLVRIFIEAYGADSGIDPQALHSQVGARKGKTSVFRERLYIRTVRSFRLRPL